jgi:hypothetical protein
MEYLERTCGVLVAEQRRETRGNILDAAPKVTK